jgi:hypothetical protein
MLDSMRTIILLIAALFVVGCGKPEPGNNGNSTPNAEPQPDGGNNGNTNGGTNGSSNSSQDGCAELNEPFKDAVRAMPRNCVTDADCKLVARAQVCDCDLAVSATSDTAEYDDVRAQLDAASCSNPFGCPGNECPYRKLAEPGELYAHCGEGGECEVLQIMSCEQYEMNAMGGIASGGGCMEATDCTLRNDLNPCDCNEAVSENFPFLVIQSINEMMDINDARCDVQCTACPMPTEAVCANDDEGYQVCQAN